MGIVPTPKGISTTDNGERKTKHKENTDVTKQCLSLFCHTANGNDLYGMPHQYRNC